LAEAYSLK